MVKHFIFLQKFAVSSFRAGLSIYLNGKLLKMEALGVLLRKKRTKTNMVTFGGAKVK